MTTSWSFKFQTHKLLDDLYHGLEEKGEVHDEYSLLISLLPLMSKLA